MNTYHFNILNLSNELVLRICFQTATPLHRGIFKYDCHSVLNLWRISDKDLNCFHKCLNNGSCDFKLGEMVWISTTGYSEKA